MKNNKKGFTLAELLVVVGIIAVLIAIAIPVFGAQLEKSREAVDAANIRAAYAEIMTAAVSGETDTTKLTKTVTLKQTEANWVITDLAWPENLTGASAGEVGQATAGGTATLTFTKAATSGSGMALKDHVEVTFAK